MIKSEVGDV